MSATAYLIFIDDSAEGISRLTLDDVAEKIGDTEADHLILIIESGGGDPSPAVSIMNLLDSRFKRISTVVPRYAKSAATLMSLGTDEIYMNPRSALGPLDLQIEHHRDGSRISALDIRNTVTSISALVDALAKLKYKTLREREISALESSRLALQNSSDLIEPILRQVDPYHLQKAERGLNVGRMYAIKMLQKRMIKNKGLAERVARSLVDDFPAHDYCIYFDDAMKLGLKVSELKDLSVWGSHLKKKYEAVKTMSYYIEFGIMSGNENPDGKKTKNRPSK